MKVQKRDGKIVAFDKTRIINAIIKAMAETVKGIDYTLADAIATQVEAELKDNSIVSTTAVHDITEYKLMTVRPDAAKAYITYRQNRKKAKKTNFNLLDDEFISKYKHSPSIFSPLGEFVYYRTYSRYIPEENRREYWWETVRRSIEYNCSLVPTKKEEAQKLFDNMYHLRQFISGRTIWVGGTEVSKTHPMANFNCAFQVIEDHNDFAEVLYLLMLGTGIGLRITKEDVAKIAPVRTNYDIIHEEYIELRKSIRSDYTSLEFKDHMAFITIGDSKNGWTDALKYYFSLIFEPQYNKIHTIVFNYNNVRPMGEKLRTFGGTASGHGALKDIFAKIDRVIKKHDSTKSKLKPIDCLDIANIIGEGVVVGGVRRTAEILLFDSDDEECIEAKSNLYKQVEGQWIVDQNIIHRSMSNNSIYYKTKPTREKLHWQMEKMRYSGEPAFVNEVAAARRRPNFKGVNPCAEILLDSKGMCNLTTVNVMAFVKDDELDWDGLMEAQRLSARAGYRMTCIDLELTKWNANQQRDRLVGCSLTGWQDMVNALGLSKDEEKQLLRDLRETAQYAAKSYAKALGQKAPLLVTTIKPEGTLSQLPVVSSGIHYSHSPYYIRRIRVNAQDPIIKVCEELGYDIKPENGQSIENCKTKVVAFPVQAPEGITKYDISAIEQLENYLMFMDNYVDHNTSITVHVRDEEWDEVEQWMWDNWDRVVAVSFLSLDNHFYEQAPYESITKKQYDEMVARIPNFIPSLISKYEKEEIEMDASADPSCATGACPIR